MAMKEYYEFDLIVENNTATDGVIAEKFKSLL
jgi:hypothetical protein